MLSVSRPAVDMNGDERRHPRRALEARRAERSQGAGSSPL